jgi:phosphatidylserine/phosphatidylglycerophosphate/cardiolipin synthase-like enzyme
MIALSNTGEVLAALRSAHDVSFTAYILPPGRMLDALAGAARSGAQVTVRLEGSPYKDDGSMTAMNGAAVDRLRAAGADASLVHETQDANAPAVHAKILAVDGALFLDDRNFPNSGADTIVRDDFPRDVQMARDAVEGRADCASRFFAVSKRESLRSEASLIAEAQRGDDVIVESESFGAHNRVFSAINAAALRGAHVRVLVNARCLLGNDPEAAAIARLRSDGVDIRSCAGDEKFAIVRGTRGWIGSANATAAFEKPDTIDWGARTDDPAIVAQERAAFEARW